MFDNVTAKFIEYLLSIDSFLNSAVHVREIWWPCIAKSNFGIMYSLNVQGAPVTQWVMRPTHNRLVPGSKHDWCKKPLVFAMIATWTIGLAAQCLNWFPSSVQPNTLKGLAKFPYYQY